MPVTIGQTESSFANPMGLLADCHRRIERFLETLRRVAGDGRGGALDDDHRRALEAALEYFREAAPKHHADEEEDLFPMLRAIGRPRVTDVLARIERLEGEHKVAAARHREVDEIGERWLRENHLSDRDAARLDELLASLDDLYRGHIAMEEREVFPVAASELPEDARQSIGRRMAARRGVPFGAK